MYVYCTLKKAIISKEGLLPASKRDNYRCNIVAKIDYI